ncbi:MAG: CDP-glycerol glycerophosphotransferase family protein [Bacteroidales bacterium]|nr:CDP-glycerol glycerophosphotransferase family protein [Bacteroidales bacterium]MBN2749516.1 CDP-glycerol glycerophosphotransferase family protein [Bacteroidales bacterium]
MRATLFCVNPYAFGILKPLYDELTHQGHSVLWYMSERIAGSFPFKGDVKVTSSIVDVYQFGNDAIFVPGNELPPYLPGVKVQVFHGLAGEKKGHFRIRHYFDLYLTQGPYFTSRFNKLATKHKNFRVKETGWCKLDPLFRNLDAARRERDRLLALSGKEKLVLYAPTFSPSLTSTLELKNEVFRLADEQNLYLMIKFHDLMDASVVKEYEVLADTRSNVEVVTDRNILKYMQMADVMISDTSSVVYEFLLLNKPVITLNSHSENVLWKDIASANELVLAYAETVTSDPFAAARQRIVDAYHPYPDGQSSARVVRAVEEYIAAYGVPKRRKLNLYRRYKMNKMFGAKPKL